MSIFDDFDEIMDYAHMWNWAPDWQVAKETYTQIPESYSVLTPFAYSYLEEMIRTTTSEYGLPLFDHAGRRCSLKVGLKLINMAIEENKENSEYVELLEKVKRHFRYAPNLEDNGRNNVIHVDVHKLSPEEKGKVQAQLECSSFIVSDILNTSGGLVGLRVYWDSKEDFFSSPIFPSNCPCKEVFP